MEGFRLGIEGEVDFEDEKIKARLTSGVKFKEVLAEVDIRN
jgi:hypothetical protein